MCEMNFLMALGKGKKLNLKILQAFGRAVENSSFINSDGCGFFDDKHIHKQILPFKMSNDSSVLEKFEDSRFVVAHSRLATSGAKTERNVHPFSSERFVWCHNGVIPMSWYEAKVKKFNIQVDSELIGYSAEKAEGKTNHEKIVNACKSINGSLSVFIYDKLEDELFYIRRDGRFNFYLIEYNGNKFIYGSTSQSSIDKMIINKRHAHGFSVDDIQTISSFVPVDGSIYKLTSDGAKRLMSVEEKTLLPIVVDAPKSPYYDPLGLKECGLKECAWFFVLLAVICVGLLIVGSLLELHPRTLNIIGTPDYCNELTNKLHTYCSSFLGY